LLLEDPIFEQMLMNEAKLALITYLLGESCTLNHFSSLVKGPGTEYLPLHTDQNQSSSPPPFPRQAQVANATWALTDYSVANGAICFVKGSHARCRAPNPEEAVDLTLYHPLEVAAGSIIIWHGNTWHGALPRTAPGVRVSVIEYFQRWYLTRTEDLSARISSAAIERNPERFAVLVGARNPALEIDTLRSRAAKLGWFA
jgi:ectoine hydroxylase-related dioxygenase (phytanoyl-CoA dioxygenase family)